MRLPLELKNFVENERWTFAKTYAETWPHEYLVRERVNEELFVRLVKHIRTHGEGSPFYRKRYIYFEEDGYVYWTMGEPVEVTTILNRCRDNQTYAYRREHGTLP